MMNKNISTLGLLGLSLFVSNGVEAQKKAPAPKKMNILFIPIDDLKPNIGAFGDKNAITPNMDRLAKSGMIFPNCYVQQAISGATRASLLTGMRPDKTKVWDLITDFRQVNPNAVSIPQYFKENGYETVGRGKIFHGGSVGPDGDGPSWSIPYKPTKAPTYVNWTPKKGEVGPAVECADVADDIYADGMLANEGMELMTKLSKENKPFFLAVGFYKPHLPFVSPKKYWDMYDRSKFSVAEFQHKAENSPDVAYHTSGELKKYTDIPQFDSYSEEELAHLPVEKQLELIHGYYAAISYTDAQIGKLLDKLDELGLTDNTIIVLWGDHGWHLGDHGLWNKHTDFEQATHAPLIMRVPGMSQGIAPTTLCEFVDIFPTLCNLTNLPIPDYLDGVSLVPAMKNPKVQLRDYAFSQYPRAKGVMGYTIRTKRFRYTEWIGSMYDTEKPYDASLTIAREFYDYDKDPLETRSLIGDPAYAKDQAEMETLFKQAMTREHAQYLNYAKRANYQKPISTNTAKKGRLNGAAIE